MDKSSSPITRLVQRTAEGDRSASQQLLPLVYDELRRMAQNRMSDLPPGQTLQATALVHEAYVRVMGDEGDNWQNRRHFFFVAARAMRDILVEEARRKAARKRGGDLVRIDVDDALLVAAPAQDMLALNLSLEKLEKDDPEGYELVMLRYFTGLTLGEIAQGWDVSRSTVDRKWRFVKAWLGRELAPGK